MPTPRRDQHWATHPVGIRLDRVWRTVEQPTETFEDAAGEPDHVTPSLPPSPALRARRPYAYTYGKSKLSLAPDLVLARMEKAGELVKMKPIRIPKPEPKPLKHEQNPDTFVPPPAAPPPPDTKPKVKPKPGKSGKKRPRAAPKPPLCCACGLRYAGGGALCAECLNDRVSETRAEWLQRENDELRERLRCLEQETLAPTSLPLYVQPFICSSCDPSSPMFDRAHSRCTAADCACYNQTPAQHDATRRPA